MLPVKIKAEVKLTTGGGVSLASRELDALAVTESGEVGLLAVLFVGGDRDLDGRWTIVDAAELHRPNGDSVSAARSAMRSMARTQPWLDDLRRHVDEAWPPFLHAFADVAANGHSALVARLDDLHRAGRLGQHLPRHQVLAVEHRKAVHDLVARHGESDAGRLAQDLLAYMLALAGYAKVTLNAVGVPDLVLEGRAMQEAGDAVALSIARSDAERLVDLCRAAGDERLARALEVSLKARP